MTVPVPSVAVLSVALSQLPFSPAQPSTLFLQLSSPIPVVSLALSLASSSLRFLPAVAFWSPLLLLLFSLFLFLSLSFLLFDHCERLCTLVSILAPKFDHLIDTLLFVVLRIFSTSGVFRNSEIPDLVHECGDFGVEDIGTPCVSAKVDGGF